jgi:hypothetical protein
VRQAAKGGACPDAGQSARVSVPMPSTAGLDRPLLVATAICRCSRRSNARILAPKSPESAECRIRPLPQLMSRLLSLHEAAGHLAKAAPDILAHPEVARAMEQALVRTMVLCLSGGETAETSSAHHRHAVIMRRLEELLEANPDRTLYTAELSSAAGVSGRTLRALLPRASGHGSDALFVAAAHASGPPRLAISRSGSDDRDRGRDEQRLLGIRALLGGISVAVRGVALNDFRYLNGCF